LSWVPHAAMSPGALAAAAAAIGVGRIVERMPQTVGGDGEGRPDSIRFGPTVGGIERAEVRLARYAYAPHRHDMYGIGVATSGVLVFRYRGARRVCLPGELHVLHPDELHDGAAATGDGLAYRIMYVAPELVRDAVADRPLPFVADPVQRPTPVAPPVASLLADIDEPISELGRVDVVAALADGLAALSGRPQPGPRTIDLRAVGRVREHLAAHAVEPTPAAALERIAGHDRFTVARHFRWAFGTSPDRYRMQRRLALARAAIERGEPLARVAAEAGFADQSHMTRQFKRTYGMTPGRWMSLAAAP
jgi:AraC-like DNA-binding protein